MPMNIPHQPQRSGGFFFNSNLGHLFNCFENKVALALFIGLNLKSQTESK